MNFKIVITGNKYPDVLATRQRDDDGKELVHIMSFGVSDDVEDYYCVEKIQFDNTESSQDFIKDFSVKSAESFCNRYNLKH